MRSFGMIMVGWGRRVRGAAATYERVPQRSIRGAVWFSCRGGVFIRRLAFTVITGIAVAMAPHTANAQGRGLVVRSVDFEGNRSIQDEVLRISIATSESSWFARSSAVSWIGLGEKRYLNETEFRRDALRITALYRQSGFLEAQVDTVVRRSETDVYITFVVNEGPPVVVDSIAVRGFEAVAPIREIAGRLPLRVGDPFNRLLMLASADTIRVRLANRGYPFAEVFRNFDVDRHPDQLCSFFG